MMHFDPTLDPPTLQRYRDYARQRQMTLSDMLLENRIVFLEGVINDAVANLTVMKLLFLQFLLNHASVVSPAGLSDALDRVGTQFVGVSTFGGATSYRDRTVRVALNSSPA